MQVERLLWIVEGEERIRRLVEREGGDWMAACARIVRHVQARPALLLRAYQHDPALIEEVWAAIMREAFAPTDEQPSNIRQEAVEYVAWGGVQSATSGNGLRGRRGVGSV